MCTERQDTTESDQIEYGPILNLIEKRFNSLWSIQKPNITLIAHPVLPESQLILVGEIYEYLRDRAGSSRFSKQPFEFFSPQDNEEPWGTREVPGGSSPRPRKAEIVLSGIKCKRDCVLQG